MYSGEATVSNDILNEVLHGGELLKIRGLWRNKAQAAESTPYASGTESSSTSLYEATGTERGTNNLSIIKESPVTVTSPTHIAHAPIPHHLPPNIDLPPHLHNHHRHHASPLSKTGCSEPTGGSHLAASSSHTSTGQPSIMSPTHDPPAHHASSIVLKKEIPTASSDGREMAVPHYGLMPLIVSSKKAPPSIEKRPAKPITENGNNNGHSSLMRSPSCAGSVGPYQQISRRYSEDNYLYAKDSSDLQPGGRSSHQMLPHSPRDIEHIRHVAEKPLAQNHQLKLTRLPATLTMGAIPESTERNESSTANSVSEAVHMMAIKQEPIEWVEFETENSPEKANIEVNVKPELVYPKADSDEECK